MSVANAITSLYNRFNPSTPTIFRITLPNGATSQNRDGRPHISIKLKSWKSLLDCALLGTSGIAISYMNGKIDIHGDLRYLGFLAHIYGEHSMLRINERKRWGAAFPVEWLFNRIHMLRHFPWTYRRAQYNAEYHYGHDADFYRYYLGDTRAYSVGLWFANTKTLEEAQHNKWEFILKKLRLKPGMKVLSVGTGFCYGEMLAAEKYGVQVDCVNVCRPQNAWVREEVKRRGLQESVRVIDDEYRRLHERLGERKYDALLAIETIEHAGNALRGAIIDSLAKCLKDEGVGVIQFLSWDIERSPVYFNHAYLYPAVNMPPMPKIMEELVLAGCEIVDLVSFRRDYNYTLNAWTDNFKRNWDKIKAINPAKYTDAFLRKWLLYLSAGAYYLITPDTTARLYQITFTKGTTTTYPMHRDWLNDPRADEAAWVQPNYWTRYIRPQEAGGRKAV